MKPKYTGMNKSVIEIPVSKKSKDYFSTPKIFNIAGGKPREVNIIRKQTMIKSKERQLNSESKKTSDKKNNQRYIIINNELSKKNNRAANYYL
jgi:hypothetical protein